MNNWDVGRCSFCQGYVYDECEDCEHKEVLDAFFEKRKEKARRILGIDKEQTPS